MSEYGPPPTTRMPTVGRRSAALELPQLIGYAAGVLGILSFIWGFLTWYTTGGQGVAGYSIAGSGAGAAIGLSIAAGLIAAVDVLEKKAAGAVSAALAVAAFLVTLGLIIGKSPDGENIGSGIGLILELVTTILQMLGLAYLWLLATGRMSAPQRRPSSATWPGGAPAGQQPSEPQHQQQTQYGPGAPPPGQFPPQPPPGGYAPAPGQYGSPQPGYGPPHAQPAEPAGPPPSGYPPPPAPAQQPGPSGDWSAQQSYPGSARPPGGPESAEPEGGPANR